MQFFFSGCVNTIIWMHLRDADKAYAKKKKKRSLTTIVLLQTVLNESWSQHSTEQQLYGHPPPISKIIQIRRTRHTGHYWRSKDELISDVLPWTPSFGRARVGRPARTYLQQFCTDTGSCDGWESGKKICASSTSWLL